MRKIFIISVTKNNLLQATDTLIYKRKTRRKVCRVWNKRQNILRAVPPSYRNHCASTVHLYHLSTMSRIPKPIQTRPREPSNRQNSTAGILACSLKAPPSHASESSAHSDDIVEPAVCLELTAAGLPGILTRFPF